MADRKIKRALIAVYDKTGIVEFARALVDEFGIEIISTGGTAKHLKDAGIPVTLVETVTGFPEMLDGRVKTLHPKIHAAILADRDNPEHMRQLAEQGIEPIDMVVVNLYPFEKTIADPNCTFEQAIEMIDIGGPCLLRAAAKNHKSVAPIPNPDLYESVLQTLRDLGGGFSNGYSQQYASRVFSEVSNYDRKISHFVELGSPFKPALPSRIELSLKQSPGMRYGENPHQLAGRYFVEIDRTRSKLLENRYPDDRERSMSFNNHVDADAALGLCSELTRAGQKIMWDRSPDRSSSANWKTPVTGEQISRRHLPHIQQTGATYFLTFRVRSGELSPAERDIVLSAAQFWHGTKLTMHAAVVMPDHVHLLITPHETSPGEFYPLGELLKSVKGYSGREISKLRGGAGAVWLDESFDRIMRDQKEFTETWDYIEANPVTAGLVQHPTEYKWFWRSRSGWGEIEEKNVQAAGGQDRLHTQELGGLHSANDRSGDRSYMGTQFGGLARAHDRSGDRSHSQACACVFIKHTNACGVGVADDPVEAYRQAYLGDPNAAMGGVLAVNFAVTSEIAEGVMESLHRWGKEAGAGAFFLEVWVAPSFDDEAVKVIRSRKKWGENVRLLAVGDMTAPPDPEELEYKTISGGMLVQTRDTLGLNDEQWKVVTKRSPDEREMADLRLAWLIAKHTKSNAISICKDGMLIGNGAGQMSRVMSCRIATWLAKENGHSDKLAGSVAASDAFFPFRDGPEILIEAGVTAIIQPGGSKRDEETIRACDERGVAMIFTGTRHFKH